MARGLSLALAVTGIALAACAPQPDTRVDLSTFRQAITVGFENLWDRHIDPFQPGPAALAGVSELASIDDRLAVDWSERSVRLLLDGLPIAEHPTPADDNIYDWAELTANLMNEARAGSVMLAAKPQEEINRVVFDGILRGRDRYSRYLGPDEARESRASRDGFGGVGVTIDIENGATVIRRVHRDTPAEVAGLRVGDRITHVDGRLIAGLKLTDVVHLLRGRINDSVVLTLRRDGVPDDMTVELIRDHIVPQSIEARTRDGIAEIRLFSFNQGTAHALRRALVRAAKEANGGLKGIVLDLRGNPGGLLDQAVAVSDIFLDEGRIIATRGRHPESNQIFDATPGRMLALVPMVVLINGRSASAAEIVAVALRDAGRAVLVGSSSFGKGSVQTIVRLPNNAELIITWARLYAPSGQTLDAQSIVPAVCTTAPQRGIDAVLAALRGEPDPALTPAALRLRAHDTHYSPARHAACPPTTRPDPRELEAARLLLANRAIYTAAIARPQPSIAER